MDNSVKNFKLLAFVGLQLILRSEGAWADCRVALAPGCLPLELQRVASAYKGKPLSCGQSSVARQEDVDPYFVLPPFKGFYPGHSYAPETQGKRFLLCDMTESHFARFLRGERPSSVKVLDYLTTYIEHGPPKELSNPASPMIAAGGISQQFAATGTLYFSRGLFWSSAFSARDQSEAESYCRQIDARLPTSDEYNTLALSMSSTSGNYNVNSISDMNGQPFWSSTRSPSNCDQNLPCYFYFDSAVGRNELWYAHLDLQVRCVK